MTDVTASPVLPRSILWLLLALAVPEVVFQMSDRGVLFGPGLRAAAYALGAFRSDLTAQDLAIFPGQAFSMYFTYMFLHIGLLHLAVNAIGLVWLWRLILNRRTAPDAVMLFAMSGVGAALVFSVLSTTQIVMVGASGALFGLLGVYFVDSRLFWPGPHGSTGLPGKLVRLIVIAAALTLSDIVSQVTVGTPVAWQAHTGGFLTGAIVALIWPRRHADGL